MQHDVIEQRLDSTGEHPRTAPLEHDLSSVAHLIEDLGHTLFTQDQDLLYEHAKRIASSSSPAARIEEYVRLILTTRVKVQEDPELDARLVTAASNAMSVLNYGQLCDLFKFRFLEVRDWSYCRIPHVNLNMAMLQGCTFDCADLRYATLYQSNLYGCSFRNANLCNVRTFESPALQLRAGDAVVAFAQDCQTLAGIASDNESVIRIWDLETFACIHRFMGHRDRVTCLMYAPNSQCVASGSQDRAVRVWNLVTGQCDFVLEGHTERIDALAFSSDGTHLATAGKDLTIRIWYLCQKRPPALLNSEDRCVRVINDAHHTGYTCMTFASNEQLLAAGSLDGIVRIWDISSTSHDPLKEFDCDRSVPVQVAFSPDDSQIVVRTMLGKIFVWCLHSGELQRAMPSSAQNNVRFSGLQSQCTHRQEKLWSALVRDLHEEPDHSGEGESEGDVSASMTYIDLASAQSTHRGNNQDYFLQPAPRAGSTSFQVCDARGMVWKRVLNQHQNRVSSDITHHEHQITSLALSPDGYNLACSNESGLVTLWDITTGLFVRSRRL